MFASLIVHCQWLVFSQRTLQALSNKSLHPTDDNPHCIQRWLRRRPSPSFAWVIVSLSSTTVFNDDGTRTAVEMQRRYGSNAIVRDLPCCCLRAVGCSPGVSRTSGMLAIPTATVSGAIHDCWCTGTTMCSHTLTTSRTLCSCTCWCRNGGGWHH